MDSFQKLARALLIAFVALCSVGAHAADEYMALFVRGGSTVGLGWSNSRAGACAENARYWNAFTYPSPPPLNLSGSYRVDGYSYNGTACVMSVQALNYLGVATGSPSTVTVSTFSTRTLQACPAATIRDANGVCALTCSSVASTLNAADSVLYGKTGATGIDVCYQGCLLSASLVASDTSGVYAAGPFSTSGAACTPTGSEGTAPPVKPRPGECLGTVNGATVSVPCIKVTTKETTTTASSTTSASGVTSSGASTSTSTTTTCTSGACTSTSTSTTTNPDGSTTTETTTGTEPKEQDTFCKENPSLSICKTSTFSGTCGTVSCEGDAIQCAIAREQAKRMCELIDTPTTMSQIGSDAATGTNPATHPRNSPDNVAVNLASIINSAPLFGSSGQCPQDVSFSHAGYNFALPFSSLCPYLQLLGAAFMASCYLLAGFIVFRRGG